MPGDFGGFEADQAGRGCGGEVGGDAFDKTALDQRDHVRRALGKAGKVDQPTVNQHYQAIRTIGMD